MKITDVERYTIPFEQSLGLAAVPRTGTTVQQLIEALERLPREALVSTDFNGSGIHATHYKRDIEVGEPA